MSAYSLPKLADLTIKYLEAEEKMWLTQSPTDTNKCFELRNRLKTELFWLNQQREKALSRINPEFNIE